MTATELYQAGRLQEALAAQTTDVKNDPLHQGKRLFLFELLTFAGDLERARRQLEAVRSEDPAIVVAFQQYRGVLDAEQQRRAFLEQGTPPSFFLPPPEHVAARLEAVEKCRLGHFTEAADRVRQADAAAPAFQGTLNDKPIEGLRDADDRFGGILEVFSRGAYYWVALEQVAALAADAPRYPRDLLYLPARLTLVDGQEGEVHLPGLYPDSCRAADAGLQLGRAVDWKTRAEGFVIGVGSRTFLAGDDAVDLRDWRRLLPGS